MSLSCWWCVNVLCLLASSNLLQSSEGQFVGTLDIARVITGTVTALPVLITVALWHLLGSGQQSLQWLLLGATLTMDVLLAVLIFTRIIERHRTKPHARGSTGGTRTLRASRNR